MAHVSGETTIVDRNGETGRVVARGESEQGEGYVLVERPGGARALVPVEALGGSTGSGELRLEREFDAFQAVTDVSGRQS